MIVSLGGKGGLVSLTRLHHWRTLSKEIKVEDPCSARQVARFDGKKVQEDKLVFLFIASIERSKLVLSLYVIAQKGGFEVS